VRYLKGQITKLGVDIRLGAEIKLSSVKEIKPDVVILAMGGAPDLPDISGINGRIVVKGTELHHNLEKYLRFLEPGTLRWLTRFYLPLGKNIVIIGGAIQGCELAEFLVKRGRKVTITDTGKQMGTGMVERTRRRLLSWFNEKGVTILTEVIYEEITEKGLAIIKEGKRQTILADNIILALPLSSNTGLLNDLEGKVPEVYAIGDCKEPRLIIDAITEGSEIAHAI
jgi:thioredoxin reductase